VERLNNDCRPASWELRPTNRSFYINLPAALADAVQLVKGEDFEWFIDDKNIRSYFFLPQRNIWI
jgi:hypothetical protein